ncbi:MAG: hydroxymethylglutaryl-CoA reductase, degradative [Phyllobacteriaceae bacterium]|nr:hydroxymethylglutaryl-CoA reductase, degradative [Phyllobacteriaceae bacterium]
MSTKDADNRSLPTSRIEGLRNLSPSQRLHKIADAASLSRQSAEALRGDGALSPEIADGMIENVIGVFELPLGVATNFIVNGRDRLIPMAVEEPSVVAAASYMARIARDHGGFETSSTDPVMRAQIQVLQVEDTAAARANLLAARDRIVALANERDTVLIGLGGGCRDIEVHVFDETPAGPMVVVHLLVDVRDAMGANTVNTMAETVAPLIGEVSGGETRLRILSNLADLRLSRARVEIPFAALDTQEYSGERIAQGIFEAWAFASVDPYRAATHNKGIMNGIDPVIIATGNDWRAIEAGAHAYAARSGSYTALTRWQVTEQRTLIGSIEMPMAVGLVGGATKTHPSARAALELMGVSSAGELGEICVAVGLAQNMAALRALATEGIQRGHMALHARNIAIMAGATGDEIGRIARQIAAEGNVTVDRAKAVLASD